MSDPSQTTTAHADEQAKRRKKRYKKSLNLPRTPFPMRANLAQNEPQTLRRWQAEGLYMRLLEERADETPFVFHDGPPYANGTLHLGHLLNKVLKDLVVRSRNLSGERCHFIPGWDCHGLPIEHQVMTALIESGKGQKLASLSDDDRRMAVRRECQRSAEKFVKLQSAQMQRLLVAADFDNPYLTMKPVYEQAVLQVFADLVDAGLVYRDLKPVHWSIANRTALAEAELEYEDRTDSSVYVRFDICEPTALATAFSLDSPTASSLTDAGLLIWTTTPWTLPANRLIAVHPEVEYALVELAGKPTVVASSLITSVAGKLGVETPAPSATAKGKALLEIAYQHPFLDFQGRVVAADYVTLEDGSGLVHTAPGHGQEDYLTGLREGVPTYCPVRGDGTYDDSVPEWLRGLSVWDANPKVVERLRSKGHLLHHEEYSHSYPHDWRSKTPVIFRATEQWFIAVDRTAKGRAGSLRQMALDATASQVEFIPDWGRKRMRGMLESRPDWCISRQRAWGLPIPAFTLPNGQVLLTSASVRAVAAAFGRDGSDAWFTKSPAELLRDWDPASDRDAPAAVEVDQLEKAYDIFDVWFESGSSWNAVIRRRGMDYPIDLYLEGSDQHRGWFQLSLLPALGATGDPPFKRVLTHGFMVDKNGRKMSKSLGNALEVEDLLKDFGADVCRWWVSSLAYENDFKVDLSFFQLAAESYRKVRNTLRFLLSNLQDYQPPPGDSQPQLNPTSIDALALERLAELNNKVQAAYQAFAFRRAHQLLFDYCNETLSALYLNAVKDRLYCDRPDSPRRRQTQYVLWQTVDVLARLLAPIVPHTAEEAYAALHGDGTPSIHLRHFADFTATADAAWSTVLELREAALKALEEAKSSGLENPLDAGLKFADPEGLLAPFSADLADLMGVSRVELSSTAGDLADDLTVTDLRDQPRCERSWRRDGTVRQRRDGGSLSDRDADAVGA